MCAKWCAELWSSNKTNCLNIPATHIMKSVFTKSIGHNKCKHIDVMLIQRCFFDSELQIPVMFALILERDCRFTAAKNNSNHITAVLVIKYAFSLYTTLQYVLAVC